jgi:Kef-type K+ transport system membrane component KefB
MRRRFSALTHRDGSQKGRSLKGYQMLLIVAVLALAFFWMASVFKNIAALLPLQASMLLLFAIVFGRIARKLHQPPVLGEIVGGVMIGPTILGTLDPSAYSWIFPPSPELHALTYFGLLCFVFTAGMNVDISCLKRRARITALTSISGILLPFALGFSMVVLLPGLWGAPAANLWIFALFMGTALSISALPVIARILMDLDLLNKELGAIILTAATIDDMTGWTLFALILSFLNIGGNLLINLCMTLGISALTVCLIYLRAKYIASDLLDRVVALTALAMLVVSFIAEFSGSNGIFGAFLSGVVLSQAPRERNLINGLAYPVVMGILAPIYFASIGLKANYAASFDPLIVVLILMVACIGKLLGAGLGALAAGIGRRNALAVGFGMNARGAMEIVLASVALDYHMIDNRIFVALVVMAFTTTMISGSMIQYLILSKPFAEAGPKVSIAPANH